MRQHIILGGKIKWLKKTFKDILQKEYFEDLTNELNQVKQEQKELEMTIDECQELMTKLSLKIEEHYNNKISYVDVLSSSFFLISSDTMQKINYMDESVFLYYEDYILAKKVKNLGLEVAIYNDAKVKHLYSVSVDKSIAEVNKYKLLKESQYYYHTIYNDANSFEKGLMKFMRRLGVIRRMIFRK